MVQSLHIKNALIWDGAKGVSQRNLYITDVEVDKPAANALTVDLDGYTIFPGLVNAHDHLELNHYPRSKFRQRYDNAHQWGEDMNARLDTEPYKTLRAYPLEDRCFIGGLKNLLCGATTVAHHNPPHKCLFRKDFPVWVLQKYGWSHSLHFSTDEEIVRSYQSTPKDTPWFIHLAEGTDDIAAREYQRLEALGCVGKNTVIVHGVGMSEEDVVEACYRKQIDLVWCPTTNDYLLGKTINPHDWITGIFQLTIGSDSRLTAEGDLLDEIRRAAPFVTINSTVVIGWDTIEADYVIFMATAGASSVLQIEGGDFVTDPPANYIVIESTMNQSARLCNSRRADLALVIKGGIPQIGDPGVMAKFPHIQTVDAVLDGKPKAIHIDLARRIQRCSLKESGLEVEKVSERRWFGFR